jgi:hypothetical protein
VIKSHYRRQIENKMAASTSQLAAGGLMQPRFCQELSPCKSFTQFIDGLAQEL